MHPEEEFFFLTFNFGIFIKVNGSCVLLVPPFSHQSFPFFRQTNDNPSSFFSSDGRKSTPIPDCMIRRRRYATTMRTYVWYACTHKSRGRASAVRCVLRAYYISATGGRIYAHGGGKRKREKEKERETGGGGGRRADACACCLLAMPAIMLVMASQSVSQPNNNRPK